MTIVVLPQAADEFDEATAHYEDLRADLGRRFRDEINLQIRWIAEHVEAPRPRLGGYRRVNLKAFPYYIAYTHSGETVWILAIAHAHRKPECWIDRKAPSGQQGDSPSG